MAVNASKRLPCPPRSVAEQVCPTAMSQSPVLVKFNREGCLDTNESLTREWIETDGLGGYAASTILFCATRRYHGLLVGRPEGRVERHVFLSRFDENVVAEDESFPISPHECKIGLRSRLIRKTEGDLIDREPAQVTFLDKQTEHDAEPDDEFVVVCTFR